MTRHPVDPVELSAYHDGALGELDRRRVEDHLAVCPACQARLAEYAWFGEALRADEEVAVPSGVDSRVRALLRSGDQPESRPRASWLWVPRPAMAAVLMAGLLLAALLAGLPLGTDSSSPLVAAAYLYDDQGEPAIEVNFSGTIDKESVARSLQIEPAVDLNVSWRGDTMVVKPKQPKTLQPSKKYTLSLKPKGEESPTTPVALQFAAEVPTTPVPLATQPAPVLALPKLPAPASSPTPRPSATTTALPSATPTTATATATSRPANTATPRPTVQPVRGFGLLYRGNPQLASRLGPALEPERPLAMVLQPFEKGSLIWRGDRKEILALLAGGQWRSYPDSFDGTQRPAPKPGEPVRGFGKLWRDQTDLRAALGPATTTERSADGVVEEFERGVLLWTPDRTIYALFGDGSWEQYADSYQDPTATPSPTPTAPTATPTPKAPTATPTATTTVAPPSPQPTSTLPTSVPSTSGPVPEPTPADIQTPGPTPAATDTPATAVPTTGPIRGFGTVYRENPTVAARLGAARAPEVTVQTARQGFERGILLWRADTREIFALRPNGSWLLYRDSWQEGELLNDAGSAPPGLSAPVHGFGKLWRQQGDLRQTFGWATAEEVSLPGAVQEFAGGRMLWTGDRVVYVLYQDGSWQSFPDSYGTPTPPAAPISP